MGNLISGSVIAGFHCIHVTRVGIARSYFSETKLILRIASICLEEIFDVS